jgi:hypothetical protein
MPELAITVGEYIGPGYVDWDSWDYVPGFTVDDSEMRLQYAECDGIQVDSILLQFGICYGGSTRRAMDVYNYLRSLGIPVRAHVMSVTTVAALTAGAGATQPQGASRLLQLVFANQPPHSIVWPARQLRQRAGGL